MKKPQKKQKKQIQEYKQPWIGIALLVVLSVLGTSYLVYGHGDEVHDEIETAGGSEYPIVSVIKATPAHLDTTGFEVSGVIHAANQTEVFPLKSGNITQLEVNTGDEVQEGQILARITSEKSDAQTASEISLLRKEMALLEDQKNLTAENIQAKINLLSQTTQEQKNLLISSEDRKERDRAGQILPLEAEIEARKVELEVAKKQYETDLKTLDLQLQAAQNQLGSQEAIILNSTIDMIDATANFLYNNPYSIPSSNSFQNHLRSELTTFSQTKTDANKVSQDFLSFHKKYQEETLVGTELGTQALTLAQSARQLSSGAFVSSDNNDFAERLTALDEAIDHYGELQSTSAELMAKVQDFETQKITKGLALEQKELQVNQLVANLEAQIDAQGKGIDVNINVEGQTLDTELKISTQELELEEVLTKKTIDMQIAERQAKIEALQQQLGWGTVVRAPFSGSITARHVSVGTSVNPSKSLFSLVDESQKFVRFYIAEDQYPFVEEDKEVTFASKFAPSESFTAPISRISKSLSEDTKQILVEADITDRQDLDRVIANMSVRVQVPLFAPETPEPHEHEEGVPEDHSHEQEVSLFAIPEAALALSENSSIVWLVNDEIEAEKRAIETAFFFDGTAYISNGLEGSEWVIVKSPVDLAEGLEVDTEVFSNKN